MSSDSVCIETPPQVNAPGGAVFHGTLLGVAVGVLVLSLLLHVEGLDKVVVPIINKPLPGICTSKRWFGIECPGCGLTRCFISIAHGDMANAWRFNPAGFLFFAFVFAQVPYRGWQLWRIRRGRSEVRLGQFSHWIVIVLCVALLAQWLVRMVV